MASPEELQLEQKARSLKLKEEALERREAQLKKTEERLKQNQDSAAKKERANQQKAQELMKRERKNQDDISLLLREREAFETAQQAAAARRPMSMFVVPIILLVCVASAYFVYLQMEKKQLHYNQIASASENIDKLASILSLTQGEVLSQSSALEDKKTELERTKGMLIDLRDSTNQLKREIALLRGDQETSASEKASLVESAELLSRQLNELKDQLEDKYLTIDIIEALVDYQEGNLQSVKGELANKEVQLTERESSLTEKQAQQVKLEEELGARDAVIAEKQTTIETIQKKLTDAEQEIRAKQQQIDALIKAQANKASKSESPGSATTTPSS